MASKKAAFFSCALALLPCLSAATGRRTNVPVESVPTQVAAPVLAPVDAPPPLASAPIFQPGLDFTLAGPGPVASDAVAVPAAPGALAHPQALAGVAAPVRLPDAPPQSVPARPGDGPPEAAWTGSERLSEETNRSLTEHGAGAADDKTRAQEGEAPVEDTAAAAGRRFENGAPLPPAPPAVKAGRAASRRRTVSAAKTPELRSARRVELDAIASVVMDDGRRVGVVEHRAWFRAQIVEGASRDAEGKPKSFEEALKEWGAPEVVHYPFGMGECCFGHGIRWGFNYVHPSGRRVEIGLDEVESFGLLNGRQRDEALAGYKRSAAQANARDPALAAVLENVGALAELPEFDNSRDRARLAALAYVAAMPGYASAVDVAAQRMGYGELPEPLLPPEALARYAAALVGLAERGRVKPSRALLRTELQLLRFDIARAVAMANKGDRSGWDKLAPRYSRLLENLSPFSIKVAALFRLLETASRPGRRGGKALAQLRRWGFLGSGPAIGVRALGKLTPLDGTYHDFDFSEAMLKEGRAALPALGERHKTHQADILRGPVPSKDGALDVVETGMMETLSAEQRAGLLLEANRVLDEGGYLVLTLKAGGLTPAFARALEREFGFEILASPEEALGYDKATLDEIAGGGGAQRQRLRSHLSGGGVLIAVKVRSANVAALVVGRDTVLAAMADAPAAPSASTGERAAPAAPEDVDLTGLDYAPLRRRVAAAAAVAAPPKATAAEPPRAAAPPPLFEENEQSARAFADLEFFLPLLPATEGRDRKPVRQRVQELLEARRRGEPLLLADAVWLAEIHRRYVEVPYDLPNISPEQLKQLYRGVIGMDHAYSSARNGADRHAWRVHPIDNNVPPSVSGPISMRGLRWLVDSHRVWVEGVPLAEAERDYQAEFGTGHAYMAVSLQGAILAAVAYARDAADLNGLAAALAAQKKLSDPEARWTRGEMGRMRRMAEDGLGADFHRARRANAPEWTLREALTMVGDRFRRALPLDPAAVELDHPGIRTWAQEWMPGGWMDLLTIARGPQGVAEALADPAPRRRIPEGLQSKEALRAHPAFLDLDRELDELIPLLPLAGAERAELEALVEEWFDPSAERFDPSAALRLQEARRAIFARSAEVLRAPAVRALFPGLSVQARLMLGGTKEVSQGTLFELRAFAKRVGGSGEDWEVTTGELTRFFRAYRRMFVDNHGRAAEYYRGQFPDGLSAGIDLWKVHLPRLLRSPSRSVRARAWRFQRRLRGDVFEGWWTPEDVVDLAADYLSEVHKALPKRVWGNISLGGDVEYEDNIPKGRLRELPGYQDLDERLERLDRLAPFLFDEPTEDKIQQLVTDWFDPVRPAFERASAEWLLARLQALAEAMGARVNPARLKGVRLRYGIDSRSFAEDLARESGSEAMLRTHEVILREERSLPVRLADLDDLLLFAQRRRGLAVDEADAKHRLYVTGRSLATDGFLRDLEHMSRSGPSQILRARAARLLRRWQTAGDGARWQPDEVSIFGRDFAGLRRVESRAVGGTSTEQP